MVPIKRKYIFKKIFLTGAFFRKTTGFSVRFIDNVHDNSAVESVIPLFRRTWEASVRAT